MPLAPPRPRLRRPLFALLLAWGGLSASAPALAQSLQALHELARAHDARLGAARAGVDAAGHRVDQARGTQRGTVGVNASLFRSATDAPMRDNLIYNTRPTAELRATRPLFNRAVEVQVEQAERNLNAARNELEEAEQDLIVRVAEAYFNVLAARDSLETARRSQAAIAEQLASAKRNFEVGTATITDAREAQARADLARAQEIAAQNQLQTARVALEQVVGRAGADPRPLARPVKLPPGAEGEVEGWAQRVEQAPAVRRARLALEVAELETRRARAGELPTVDLVGSYGKSRNSGSAAGTFGIGTTTSTSVGVQANWPLYTGGAVPARVRETLSLSERARQDLENAQRTLAQTTRQAYYTVRSGEAQVQALEAAEASSQLALEATQTGYRVGVRINIDVLNAQTQLFTTRRDLDRARYDLLLGQLRLRQAAGVLGAADVARFEALLQR